MPNANWLLPAAAQTLPLNLLIFFATETNIATTTAVLRHDQRVRVDYAFFIVENDKQ